MRGFASRRRARTSWRRCSSRSSPRCCRSSRTCCSASGSGSCGCPGSCRWRPRCAPRTFCSSPRPCCARLPASWRGARNARARSASATAPCATSSRRRRCRLRTRTASSWPRRTTRCAWPPCPSAAASPARYTTTWVICSQDRCCRWRRCKWCTPTTSAFAAGWHRWARRCTRPWTRCAKACTTCTTMRSIYARVWKASSAPAAWTTSSARRCRTWRSTATPRASTCRSSNTRLSTSSSCRITVRATVHVLRRWMSRPRRPASVCRRWRSV